MANFLIEPDTAESNVFMCAAFVADSVGSAGGHANAASDIALRLAARGELDLAAQLADQIEDPHTRDVALTEIAARCADFDDDEYGLQLAEAIEEYGFQQQAISQLAVRQAERGRLEQSLETANSLDDPSTTLAEIAIRFARQGDVAQAQQIFEQIDFPTVRVQVLNEFAAIKIKNNEPADDLLSDSLAEAENIEYAEERSQLLLEIVSRLLDTKQTERALEVLEKTRQLVNSFEPRFRDQVLTQISSLYAHSGNFEQAEKVLEPIVDLQQTATGHVAIALEHQAQGDTEQAVSSLEEAYATLKSQPEREIRDSKARFNLFATIAVRLAQFGRFERAIEIAVENPVEESRNAALVQIAAICAANQKEELARQAANAIEVLAARQNALIGISDGEIKNGEAEKSLQTLEEAHSLTEEVGQFSLRSEALNQIAVRFVERGEREKAGAVLHENLRVIQTILDD
ncbi:MAG TPA: hypothetical protein VEX64_05920, partial [Pyrinomonadaceae bacterium]|nr:hypothetical protein [Pyrinomonadaceae bacterium]